MLFRLFLVAAALSAAVGCADVGDGQLDEAEEGVEEAGEALISTNISANPTLTLDPRLDPNAEPTALQSTGVTLINCEDGADNCRACGGGWVPAMCKRLTWYGGCAEMTQAFCNYAH